MLLHFSIARLLLTVSAFMAFPEYDCISGNFLTTFPNVTIAVFVSCVATLLRMRKKQLAEVMKIVISGQQKNTKYFLLGFQNKRRNLNS